MRFILLAVAALSIACAAATTDSTESTRETFPAQGGVQLTVEDAPAMPGLFYALPSVTGEAGEIRVQHTRYGSLCLYALSGDAQTDGARVAIHISFSERLTSCVAQIRSLTYHAALPIAPGTYDVLVIHHETDTRVDTLTRRTVTVR